MSSVPHWQYTCIASINVGEGDSLETKFQVRHSEKVESQRLVAKSATKIQSQGSYDETNSTNILHFLKI